MQTVGSPLNVLRSDGFRAGALVVAVLLIANGTLVVGRHTGRFDASDFFCPYFVLIADCARQGEFLTWTPLVECGCPAGFDPEIGAFSPLTVGLAAVLGPHEWAFRVYWLTIWCLGGLGILVLARHWRALFWAAVAAAIAYAFSAVFTGQAEYTAYLVVMAAVPWTLWRLEAGIDSQYMLPGIQAGAIWGLAALSGYPSLIIIGYCYLAAWCFGRVWRRWTLRRLTTLALFVVVGLGVLSPAYVGFLQELQGYTDRQHAVPREEAIGAQALDPKALSTFASPYVATAAATGEVRLWPTDLAMCSIYLSPLLVVLGLSAPWLRRSAFGWWVGGMGLICLAASLGTVLPVRGWLYDLLPPMRYFRHAAAFRCFFLLTLVLLGAMAARDFQRSADERNVRRLRRLGLLAAALAIIASATLAVVLGTVKLHFKDLGFAVLSIFHVLAIWFGCATMMLHAWWLARAGKVYSFAWPALALVIGDAVLTILLGKAAMYTDRREFWTATEKAQRSTMDLNSDGLARRYSLPLDPPGPRNACLVTKVPVLRCFNVLRSDLYDRWIEDPQLAEFVLGTDRVWFSAWAAKMPRSRETLNCLIARARDSQGMCVVVSDPTEEESAESQKVRSADCAGLNPAAPLAVRWVRYDNRELSFDVNCPHDGWLLVTDRWAPGWRVLVNDLPCKAWIGNLVFRAVEVSQGENRICFRYQPRSFPWLVSASWLLLSLAGISTLAFSNSGRRG